MEYLLLGISLCLGSLKNLTSKFSSGITKNLKGLFYINTVTSVAAIIIFALSGISFKSMGSPLFVILAFFYGMATVLSQSMYIYAVQKGSVSVCTMIYSCGFLIPTIFSFLAYGDSFGIFNIIGIALLVISIFLISGKEESKKSNAYMLLAFVAMLASGTVGILQKVFVKTFGTSNLNSFLFLSFLFMLAASSLGFLFAEGKLPKDDKKAFYTVPVILALCTVFCNKINLFLSGRLNGIIFFPVVNGGVIFLTAVLSYFILKEKNSLRKNAGIIISIVAIAISFIK